MDMIVQGGQYVPGAVQKTLRMHCELPPRGDIIRAMTQVVQCNIFMWGPENPFLGVYGTA